MAWVEFTAAYIIFLASHAIPARPPVRVRLVGWLGERWYLAGYIAVSLGLLVWLISAASRAPFVMVWPFALWQLWVPNIALPLACLLAAFGVAARNPLSFGGRAEGFDPATPGIAGVTRHPILWALALWAGSHAVPNGNLAHVLLFGGFAVFALVGGLAIDARLRRRWGAEEWRRLSRRTSFVPLAGMVTGRTGWPGGRPDPRRLAAAVALYLALLMLHPGVIGVSPLPVWVPG